MTHLTVPCLPFSNINSDSSSPFADRTEAGRVLAEIISRNLPQRPLILALPRGGVPVASEIAKALHCPLDIFLVRKFGLPENPDFHIGTVASGGVYTLECGESQAIQAAMARERAELERREESYRQGRAAVPIANRLVIVVDDGLTTGFTMRNAVRALRHRNPARIIAAIPVASPEVCAELESVADTVVCARTPSSFQSVRRCYRDFSPVLDTDIRNLLSAAARTSEYSVFHA